MNIPTITIQWVDGELNMTTTQNGSGKSDRLFIQIVGKYGDATVLHFTLEEAAELRDTIDAELTLHGYKD